MLSITNRKGQNHVTSAQFRDIIQSILGDGSYIANLYNLMEPELSTNNTIKIKSGVLIHHGYVSEIQNGTYDEINYQNGTQGMLRIDLVVARYKKTEDTQIEDMEWVVIRGTPDALSPVLPDYIVGNMQEGDLTDDCPVFEIHFDGINVTEVKKLLPIIPAAAEVQEELNSLNSNFGILNSDSNTDKSAFKIRLDAILGAQMTYGCWDPGIYPYHSNLATANKGAPTDYSGVMLVFRTSYGDGSTWNRWIKLAIEISGSMYIMNQNEEGVVARAWTKIAGPA